MGGVMQPDELTAEDMKFLRDHPKGEVEVFECEYLGYPNSPWPVRGSEKVARYRLVDGKPKRLAP